MPVRMRRRKDSKTKTRGFEWVSAWQDKKIHLPQRKTAASAGYDIEAGADVLLLPAELTMVPTGVKAFMQLDEVLMIHIRSSMAIKHQLVLMNSVAVVDSDYYNNEDNEGHIFAKLTNDSKTNKIVTVRRGDAFMQGIFVEYGITEDDKVETSRNGGFGSTDKNKKE